jgi:hypothetical protein
MDTTPIPFQRGIERLRCLLGGHRALARAGAYGRELPDGHWEELRYCGACGSAVWTKTDHPERAPNNRSGAGPPE